MPSPLMVINGGPKLSDKDLGEVAAHYCRLSGSQDDIKSRLEALQEIWDVIQGARGDSEKWGGGYWG